MVIKGTGSGAVVLPVSPFIDFVTLNKLLKLSNPLLPQQQNEAYNSTNLIGLL